MFKSNYKRITPIQDEYYIGKAQKVYLKFRKIDTLYYMDYSGDSTALTGIVKSDSVFQIDHYPCKLITINFHGASSRYYYSTDLRFDPVHDSTNTIGHYNDYLRATGGAVYLWNRIEYPIFVMTDSCIRVEPKKIDDHVFDLPGLPVKKFSFASLIMVARFPGKPGSWLAYLESNLNSKLALKYVKLPRGQSEASVTVYVEFVVGEDGNISNIHVDNQGEVSSKLAEEAMRVIRESPRWLPGTVYGEKFTSPVKQPVVLR